MLTANYLTDVLYGLIDDISTSLEIEEVMFEILMNDSLLIGEDDINYINKLDNKLIYSGRSYRYITLPSEKLPFLDRMDIVNKRINDITSCYYWSKSLFGLNKFNQSLPGEKILVSSDINGLDMAKLTSRLIKLSRLIKKQGYKSKFNEFFQLRDTYRKTELVVAPNGLEIQIQLNS